MNFRSDNTAGAAAEMLAALSTVNEKPAPAYGEDAWSQKLNAAFTKLFERDVRVFTVATGTAANAIALASYAPPWGGVLCHREAHIECDECGAPEFYSGGAKLVLIDGEAAKITPGALEEALTRNRRGVHSIAPAVLSISQATERGAAYRPGEIAALSEIARREGLAVHVDGARFANAVAALGCTPAELSWKAGIDAMSFGATKNGALAAEAIVLFDLARADEIARRRKRGGHLLCKGRYAAAQLLAYLEDGLWLRLAKRANGLAARLGDAASAWLTAPVETNQVFIRPGAEALAKLRSGGAEFYDWGGEGSGEARLVVSWNQPESDIDQFSKLAKSLR